MKIGLKKIKRRRKDAETLAENCNESSKSFKSGNPIYVKWSDGVSYEAVCDEITEDGVISFTWLRPGNWNPKGQANLKDVQHRPVGSIKFVHDQPIWVQWQENKMWYKGFFIADSESGIEFRWENPGDFSPTATVNPIFVRERGADESDLHLENLPNEDAVRSQTAHKIGALEGGSSSLGHPKRLSTFDILRC